jgi:subtilisin family serine protease
MESSSHDSSLGQYLAQVAVSVNIPEWRPTIEIADVRLRRGESSTSLYRTGEGNVYRGAVEPGDWELTAAIPVLELIAPVRVVNIPQEGKNLSEYLGKADWPFYPYGGNRIPFEPHEDVIVVCFETRRPVDAEIPVLLAKLIAAVPGLSTFENARRPSSFLAARGAMWLLRYSPGPTSASVFDKIREFLSAYDARVGMPVDLVPGQLKVLDRRFVIQFPPDGESRGLEAIAAAHAAVVRGSSAAPRTWIIDFLEGTFRDHLGIVEKWIDDGVVLWAEPDILAEISNDAFPPVAHDPQFKKQESLAVHQVPETWLYLKNIHPDLTLGSPAVYVASVDHGIDPAHPDIGGNLADGTAQIASSYDFVTNQPCTSPGYQPTSNHGMGVYGIIAAVTNNRKGISGIAPNTHQIAIRMPDLQSAAYPEVLLWAAGLSTNPLPGWPAQPSPPADIINCSHGVDGLALSSVMDATLNQLAGQGRGGLGALVVYSAGNRGFAITGFRVWAAHPKTIAVSNAVKDDTGEHFWRGAGPSNWGPEIDLCALGQNTWSLDLNGDTQAFQFTSAAAPIVAAAAALMLSKNPNLTWAQLRDKLRQTACKIDPGNADADGQWVNGFSQWYGYGRLDVLAAVTAA